ncbi:MAG TPA: aminotransferase class I/II-fold pyridoxal phosphate-dependent enzyme [Candidatus Krumholzibacteria bacterium]|nr:aminotransferase class I/II-fold pyridoxal phosphate-dependent enzyme [Candidatus Krumholzibacteria bacterium]
MIQPAKRIQKTGRYVFEEIARMKREDTRPPEDIFDLGVGSPDQPPDPAIIEMMAKQLRARPFENHRYSSFDGAPEFRRAVANWYKRRFNVSVDPDKEVLPLIGSKDGISKLMLAYLDPGDTIVVATPCYPAYLGAAKIVEANVVELPLKPENNYLPDFAAVPHTVWEHAKFLFLNYPNNPVGAAAPLSMYKEAVALAEKFDFIVVSDLAYSELALEPNVPTPSILQVPEAADVAIEFHSFSKSYNMAGWRLGYVLGNREVISNLVKIKSNMDFAVFLAIQRTGADILDSGIDFAEAQRKRYRARRDLFIEGFGKLGWRLTPPPAAMYIWDRVPKRYADATDFAKEFFKATGVIVSPGSAFGSHSKEFMRISMVVDEQKIERLLAKVKASGFRFD